MENLIQKHQYDNISVYIGVGVKLGVSVISGMGLTTDTCQR